MLFGQRKRRSVIKNAGKRKKCAKQAANELKPPAVLRAHRWPAPSPTDSQFQTLTLPEYNGKTPITVIQESIRARGKKETKYMGCVLQKHQWKDLEKAIKNKMTADKKEAANRQKVRGSIQDIAFSEETNKIRVQACANFLTKHAEALKNPDPLLFGSNIPQSAYEEAAYEAQYDLMDEVEKLNIDDFDGEGAFPPEHDSCAATCGANPFTHPAFSEDDDDNMGIDDTAETQLMETPYKDSSQSSKDVPRAPAKTADNPGGLTAEELENDQRFFELAEAEYARPGSPTFEAMGIMNYTTKDFLRDMELEESELDEPMMDIAEYTEHLNQFEAAILADTCKKGTADVDVLALRALADVVLHRIFFFSLKFYVWICSITAETINAGQRHRL